MKPCKAEQQEQKNSAANLSPSPSTQHWIRLPEAEVLLSLQALQSKLLEMNCPVPAKTLELASFLLTEIIDDRGLQNNRFDSENIQSSKADGRARKLGCSP